MMSRLVLAALCAVLAFPVLAEEERGIADVTSTPESERNAAQTPADVDMAKVRAAEQPASGVPATPAGTQPAAAQPEGAQPGANQPGASQPGGSQAGGSQPAEGQPGGEAQGAAQSQAVESKSSIPLDKRQGGDITQCLEAGDKSDKAIAACAEKFRPRSHSR